MADALSISMGGRIANIYKQNTKRRRFTTVVNDIENKRLGFIKKQLEYDRLTEYHKLERYNNKLINANDEMKAFQVALLRRIGAVKDESKRAAGTRPLMNLGRYGGASVEYIKAESEKYKRIRDPQKRRMIKTRIYLEQGKRDGRIKNFEPEAVGDLAEDILQLYKCEPPPATRVGTDELDIANLNDVYEVDEGDFDSIQLQESNEDATNHSDLKRATYPVTQPRRLILPPLQVKRSSNPNSNYYRKISADYHKRQAQKRGMNPASSPIHRRLSVLQDIIEEGDVKRRNQNDKGVGNDGKLRTPYVSNANGSFSSRFPVTSLSTFSPQTSKDPQFSKTHGASRRYFEWDYTKPVGPVRVGKHLNDGQKFWRPQDSFPSTSARSVVLPSIH